MSTPLDSYLTLAANGTAEATVQRSRFLAVAAPAADPTTAQDLVADLRRRYHDARHVCSAWRLGAPDRLVEFRHDDGEPSGTAGEPILAAIRKAGLTHAVVAVVRYFGGVKLGTGGLSHAYGGVAQAALAAAPRRTVRLGRCFTISFDYAQQKTLQRLLTAHGGSTVDESYDVQVHWRIWLPHSTWTAFARAAAEATAGRVQLAPADDGP